MFQSLLKYFGPWLLKQLIPVLDPDAAARAKALDEKIAAIEKREAEAAELQRKSDEAYVASQLQYQQSEQRRAELDAQHQGILKEIEIDEQIIRESEVRRTEIRDAATKAKAAIDARTDDDALSGGVPKSSL